MHSKTFIRLVSLAIAAAVILAILGLWPRHAGNGIVWADVVRQINQAKTLVSYTTVGDHYTKAFIKDPDLQRIEVYYRATSRPADTEVPDSIEIRSGSGADWQTVEWRPADKLVRRYRTDNCPYSNQHPQTATGYWQALRRVSSNDAKRIGQTYIDGISVVVFQVSEKVLCKAMSDELGWEYKEDYFENHTPRLMRIYVSSQNAAPLRLEAYEPNNMEGKPEQAINIQWDIPLSDALFQVPSFDQSWKVVQTRRLCFSSLMLKKGVMIRIGSPENPPIISEADIERIPYGLEGIGTIPTVVVELTQTAIERLRTYAQSHPNELFYIELDGKILEQVRIYPQVQKLQLNISALNITLEQFEEEYLTLPSDKVP